MLDEWEEDMPPLTGWSLQTAVLVELHDHGDVEFYENSLVAEIRDFPNELFGVPPELGPVTTRAINFDVYPGLPPDFDMEPPIARPLLPGYWMDYWAQYATDTPPSADSPTEEVIPIVHFNVKFPKASGMDLPGLGLLFVDNVALAAGDPPGTQPPGTVGCPHLRARHCQRLRDVNLLAYQCPPFAACPFICSTHW